MYKNAVIESLMLKRDITLLHDEINALKSKLAEHDHDAQPEMQFMPIESPAGSVTPSPEPAPTPDPIPPPSPEPEPRLAESLPPSPPFPERHTIFSPTPIRRCVNCSFAKSCLRCKHSV